MLGTVEGVKRKRMASNKMDGCNQRYHERAIKNLKDPKQKTEQSGETLSIWSPAIETDFKALNKYIFTAQCAVI